MRRYVVPHRLRDGCLPRGGGLQCRFTREAGFETYFGREDGFGVETRVEDVVAGLEGLELGGSNDAPKCMLEPSI